ncbi:hypothetical protein H2200_008496 [Cladophialophora chaetospira]|uniref:Uncharacterized protein n=1 Tax=Cladophialophora chaetospira TaxID=386627 RepID=A0AA38X5V8_9EURO|nr:hypothetical protein H2200_008496 [Cladophialophora chaetospira]
MSTFAETADTMDFLGIYRTCTHSEEEKNRREAWMESIRYRFAETVMLPWKWKMNVHPDVAADYKKAAFKKFRKVSYQREHRDIIDGLSVEDVPVHDIVSLDLQVKQWPSDSGDYDSDGEDDSKDNDNE